MVDARGAEQFSLLGISQGAAVSIDYAVRYPERFTTIRPDFQTYLRKLREIRVEAGDRARVIQKISTFLFGEQDALGANWA